MNQVISKNQMRRLQTLYSQLAAHAQEGSGREARIRWASEQTGRAIASFSELTGQEARFLINGIQGQLGVKAPAQKRRRLDRDAARRAGTEGRKGNTSNESTMAGAPEFARIQYALDLLGWNQDQLNAWLHSPKSPLRGHATPVIRTLGDANRIWWALKGMATARGLWKKGTA